MKRILLTGCLAYCCALQGIWGQTTGVSVGNYGNYTDLTTTNPLQEALGVGDFGTTTGNLPQARLHLNTFRMGSSSNNFLGPFSEGFLLRTDGDRKVINQWSMWSGENATAQTEKFRLYIDAETDEPFMGIRSLTNGIRFETEVSDVRMRINGAQNNTINTFNVNTSGFVAISGDQQFWTLPGAAQTASSLYEPNIIIYYI